MLVRLLTPVSTLSLGAIAWAQPASAQFLTSLPDEHERAIYQASYGLTDQQGNDLGWVDKEAVSALPTTKRLLSEAEARKVDAQAFPWLARLGDGRSFVAFAFEPEAHAWLAAFVDLVELPALSFVMSTRSWQG